VSRDDWQVDIRDGQSTERQDDNRQNATASLSIRSITPPVFRYLVSTKLDFHRLNISETSVNSISPCDGEVDEVYASFSSTV